MKAQVRGSAPVQARLLLGLEVSLCQAVEYAATRAPSLGELIAVLHNVWQDMLHGDNQTQPADRASHSSTTD